MAKIEIYIVTDNSRRVVYKRRFLPLVSIWKDTFDVMPAGEGFPPDGAIIIFLVFNQSKWTREVLKRRDRYLLVYDNSNDLSATLKPELWRKASWMIKSFILNKTHKSLEFKRFLKLCDTIVTGSVQQSKSLNRLGYSKTHSIVDPISELEYKNVFFDRSDRANVILWEGTEPSMNQLELIEEELVILQSKTEFKLLIFCDPPKTKRGIALISKLKTRLNDFEFVPWDQNKFKEVHQAAKLAIAPIDKMNYFNLAKPENKLISYGAFGLPVVCSDIPSYRTYSEKVDYVFISDSSSEWIKKIESLLKGENNYKQISKDAYDYVWSNCNEAIFASAYKNILSTAYLTKLEEVISD